MVHPRIIDEPLGALVAKLPKDHEAFMKWVSNLGGAFYAISALIITATLAILNKDMNLLTYVSLTAIFAPLAEGLKLITKRKRPETLYAENMKFKSYSFPSGHSYVSSLIAGFLSVLALTVIGGTIGWILVGIAISTSFLIGLSRVYLGAHFPTDVLAGWTLGAFVTVLVAYIHSGLNI